MNGRWRSLTIPAVILACVAGVSPLTGQTIRGEILDLRTGLPIRGVAVLLLDRNFGTVLRVQSNADGRYVVQASDPGTYRLRFEIPGYRLTITEPLNLKRDEAREYPVRLTPASAVALDTVVVAGETVPRHLMDFYIRKSRGQGTFLTPADLERLHPVEPTDVVRRLEGFDLSYDRFEPSRKLIRNKRFGGMGQACVPVIFVDGVHVGRADTYDVNAVLWVDKLDAVESYPSPARIPIEYNTTGTQCGVIAFWTKR